MPSPYGFPTGSTRMMDTKLQQQVAEIDGWLFPSEGRLLYRLAQAARGDGVIVEIGSWKGKSTVCLAAGSAAGPRLPVYAIDPHTGSPEHQQDGNVQTFETFQQNIRAASVSEWVRPIVKYSNDALEDVPEPIELLFIDGAHEYDAVMRDFQDWFPKVRPGGIVAFHDTLGWPGPRRVVREHLYGSRHFKNVRFVQSISYGRKGEHATAAERLGNRLMWVLHEIYEGGFRMATLPAVKRLLGRPAG